MHLDVALPATTPSARLTSLTAADAREFAVHISSDLERLSVFLPWPALTADEAGAAAWLGRYDTGDEGRALVAGLRVGGRLLGGVVLFRHDEHSASAELGCWAVAEGEGRGLVRAGCVEALRVARSGLRAERVVWQSDPANTRSRALAERLGFHHEGTLRSAYVLRDERRDSDLLSLVGVELDRAVS